MGQIKNIKLHIVTDIKGNQYRVKWLNPSDCTAKVSSWATNVDFATNRRTPPYFASKVSKPKKTLNSTWANESPMCTVSQRLPLPKAIARPVKSEWSGER